MTAGCYSSSKLPSVDLTPTNSPDYNNIRKTASTQSQNSNGGLQPSGSHEGRLQPPKRKRPLAVAVGFKYAEDMHGRPIVITPGDRRMPVYNRKNASPASPASQPVDVTKKGITPNVLFPIDDDRERPNVSDSSETCRI